MYQNAETFKLRIPAGKSLIFLLIPPGTSAEISGEKARTFGSLDRVPDLSRHGESPVLKSASESLVLNSRAPFGLLGKGSHTFWHGMP